VMQILLVTALIVEIVAYFWLGLRLSQRGHSWLQIAPLIGTLAVLWRMMFVLPSFVFALILRWKLARQIPWGNALKALAKEIDSRAFGLSLLQTLPQLFMHQEPLRVASPQGNRPILLVHGYFSNRGIWWTMRRRLAKAGLGPIYTVSLNTPFGSIDRMVPTLTKCVAEILKATGAPTLDIVAHSMGGLVTRAMMVDDAISQEGNVAVGLRIGKFITLGSPHHGTKIAKAGIGECVVEMREDSAWLKLLEKREESTAKPITTSIYTMNDDLVYPPETARLNWAENVPMAAVGHVSLLFSVAATERVIAVLKTDRESSHAKI
jgi:triacylglycerol lipase